MKRTTLQLSLVAIVTVATIIPAPAQNSYTFKDISPAGSTFSQASGVNRFGQVVGIHQPVTNGPNRAFLYIPAPAYGFSTSGSKDLGAIGGDSFALAINESGEVVGGGATAFIWLPSANYGLSAGMNDLNTLPCFAAAGLVAKSGNAINNSHIVGGRAIATADNLSHGFILNLSSGALTDLGAGMNFVNALTDGGLPKAVGNSQVFDMATAAYTSVAPLVTRGINNAGAIAASNLVGNNYHAFYRDPAGVLTDLGGLAFNASRANGINNAGTYPAAVLCGYTYTNQGKAIAFRWRVGSSIMQDLNGITSGKGKSVLVEALAVADSGHIVGYATLPVKGSNLYQAFLLTPQ